MPVGGLYAGNPDDVTADALVNAASLNGWPDMSGQAYGPVVAGGTAYRFGAVANGWGTWGQQIFGTPASLIGPQIGAINGLAGAMPGGGGLAPDGYGFVQGHLVNAEAGGASTMAANLVPFSSRINQDHKHYEAAVKFLMNLGDAAGVQARIFNPNNIPNSRLIYRVHRCDPIAVHYPGVGGAMGTHPHLPVTLPHGIGVSLGIVINGAIQTAANLTLELARNPLAPGGGGPLWFDPRMYTNGTGVRFHARLDNLIHGHEIAY